MPKEFPPDLERRRLEILPERGAKRTELLAETPRRLQILEVSSGYGPEKRGVPSDLSFSEGNLAGFQGASRHHLTIRGLAARKLFEHIGWGAKTGDNGVEQGGLLLGRVFEDQERDLVCGLVEDAVPARLARGSSTYLHFSAPAWKEMLDYVDLLEDSDRQLKVIGWYHTHPGSLGVFMSGTDQDAQRSLFYEDWHFSLVLNPQRREFRVYHGADSQECRGNIIPYLRGKKKPEENGKPTKRNEGENKRKVVEEVQVAPIQSNAVPKRDSASFLIGFLLATALLVGTLTYLTPRFTIWLAGARDRERPPRGTQVPTVQNSEVGPEKPDKILKVRAEVEATKFLQGFDPGSARETLRLLPPTTLRAIAGPYDGWYRVEIREHGWVRERDLLEVEADDPTPSKKKDPARKPAASP